MTTISEAEFARLCQQIYVDREQIYQFNVAAARDEVLLWMLLGCLISYLSLTDAETPCFPGSPDAQTYQQAILHVLRGRMETPFDAKNYLSKMVKQLEQ